MKCTFIPKLLKSIIAVVVLTTIVLSCIMVEANSVDNVQTFAAPQEVETPAADDTKSTENTVSVTAETDADYVIASIDDLVAFRNAVNAGAYTATAVVTADIDMSSQSSWTPIGVSKSTSFKGTFDGGGHKFTNLNSSRTSAEFTGLFGRVAGSAVIKNLILVSGTIAGNDYTGGVLGAADDKTVTIDNVKNLGVNVTGRGFVSGISGSNGTVNNSCNYAKIIGSTNRIAGIAGQNANINNCYNQGNVTGSGQYVAGIVGTTDGSTKNCYNTGTVKGGSSYGAIRGNGNSPSTSYYLTGSCTNAGGGTVKTEAQFIEPDSSTTGVSYLLNNSRGSNYQWYRQYTSTSYPTFEEPIIDIYDLTTLQQFRDYVNEGGYSLKGTVIADIDMSGESNWTPIGTSTIIIYKGIFDGGGHTFTGISIDTSTSYNGLFGRMEAGTIKDLTLALGSVKSSDEYTGALIGCASGTTTVDNVKNIGVSVSGAQYVGGILGYGATTTNCYNLAEVSGTTCVGGILGYLGTVTNSYNIGNIVATDNSGSAGGIAGPFGIVTNCYNKGKVTGDNNIGGVASSYGTVTNSYNTGAITCPGSTRGGVMSDGTSTTVFTSYYLDTSCDSAGGGISKTSAEFNALDTSTTVVSYLLSSTRGSNNQWYHQYTAPHYQTFEIPPEVIKVTVSWNDMGFKYDGTKMVWNLDTHEYKDNGAWIPKTTDANKVTIVNESSVSVVATFEFTKNSKFTDVTGSFTNCTTPITSIELAAGDQTPQTGYEWFVLSGLAAKNMQVGDELGSITVALDQKE